jgi:light-independent protochlorophyllide reductase subunit B
VLFDTLVHPLVMGLKNIFWRCFAMILSFTTPLARPISAPKSQPSHQQPLPALTAGEVVSAPPSAEPQKAAAAEPAAWSLEAEKELGKIPFFVRGKARRNTETYANERAIPIITVETLYDAKAHFGR